MIVVTLLHGWEVAGALSSELSHNLISVPPRTTLEVLIKPNQCHCHPWMLELKIYLYQDHNHCTTFLGGNLLYTWPTMFLTQCMYFWSVDSYFGLGVIHSFESKFKSNPTRTPLHFWMQLFLDLVGMRCHALMGSQTC